MPLRLLAVIVTAAVRVLLMPPPELAELPLRVLAAIVAVPEEL